MKEERLYICIVSGYNLPELEACLEVKPKNILLIVSNDPEIQKNAELLTNALKENLPHACIYRPDQEHPELAFDGTDIIQVQNWIKEVLLPYLKKPALDNTYKIINLTGGTKALPLALLYAYPWDALHYKPEDANTVSVFHIDANGGHEFYKGTPQKIKLTDASPITIAKLHSEYVEEVTSNISLANLEVRLQLAEALYQGLQKKDAGLTGLFKFLNKYWSEERNKHKKDNLIQVPIQELLTTSKVELEALKPWLDRIQQLTQYGTWGYNQEKISFPSNKGKDADETQKEAKTLKAWISGLWLEEYIYHCIAQKVDCKHIAANLKVGKDAKTSETKREVDILLHYQGRTSVVEIKADYYGKLQDIERQVSSLGDKILGRSTKILFIGPEFTNRLKNENQFDNFNLRCKSKEIILCDSVQSLLEALKLA